MSRTRIHDMTNIDFDAYREGRPQPSDSQDPSTVRTRPVTCPICQDLDFRPIDYDLPVDLKIKIPDLKNGRDDGCTSCILLSEALIRVFEALEPVESLVLKSTAPSTPLISWVDFQDGRRREYLEFFVDEGSPSKWPIIGAAHDISHDSSSQSCMALATSFLNDCTKNHKECHRLAKPSLPTRVIDIGSEGGNIKLYETTAEEGDYAALSHCWGQSANPVITTSKNLPERVASIKFNDLPKTFQDAVTITRRLGVPYLWIDSLCIIQDSAEDWAKEAMKMSSIYTDALVTIAADGSEDSKGGCFIGKDRLHTLAHLDCAGPEGERREVKVRFQGIRPDGNSISHANRLRPRSKLSTRGWVLQERLLSPRTLHFTATEMAWECAAQIRCECRVIPEPASDLNFKGRFIASYAHDAIGNTPTFNWSDVVEEFTARDLTYQKDRLVALSGIAATMSGARPQMDYESILQTFSQIYVSDGSRNLPTPAELANTFAKAEKQPYVAGLWDNDMEIGLLWHTAEWVENKRYISTRQESHVAPSWSWASITGAVTYVRENSPDGKDRFQQFLGMQDVICEPATSNIFGSVRIAEIKTNGFVVPVRLHRIGNSSIEKDEPSNHTWLVISERDFRDDRRAYFQSTTDMSTRKEPAFQFIAHKNPSPPQDLEYKVEPISERAFSIVNANNIRIIRGTRIEMPQESPHDFMYPDIYGDGYEVDQNEEYLLLLVGYQYELVGERERKKRAYGLVLKRGSAPRYQERWMRVGMIISRWYWWDSWLRVASPYNLTLV